MVMGGVLLPIVFALTTEIVAREQVGRAASPAHSCILVQELSASKPLVRAWRRGVRDASLTRVDVQNPARARRARNRRGDDRVDPEMGRDAVPTAAEVESRSHTDLALRPSVLWVFQRIAPQVGAQRMAQWLNRFNYGNQDTSGPIAEYWTNGRLSISPAEQLDFVRRFYRNELPVAAEHLRAVRDGLQQRAGTMENSLGVHPLAGDWQNATLNAKTGATTTSDTASAGSSACCTPATAIMCFRARCGGRREPSIHSTVPGSRWRRLFSCAFCLHHVTHVFSDPVRRVGAGRTINEKASPCSRRPGKRRPSPAVRQR